MRTEAIIGVLVILAIVLKFTQWPGANIALLLLLLTLCLMYFGFGFYFFADKNIRNQNLALSIASGILLSALPVGILYKILHWHGEDIMLMVGLYGGVIVFCATLFLKSNKNQLKTYYNNMLLRTIILSAAGLVFYLIDTKKIFPPANSNKSNTSQTYTPVQLKAKTEQVRQNLAIFVV